MTNRKPHSGNAGYVCELKNRRTGIGHVVVYDALRAGIDCGSDSRWAVVCETHNTIVECSSLKSARASMIAVDFCEECAAAPDGDA